jgi:hypothetical protein
LSEPEKPSSENNSEAISPDGPNLAAAAWNATTSSVGSMTHPLGTGGVFSSLVKTVTGKNTYEIDNAERAFKRLQPTSMQEAMAMPGMDPGAQQHVIRGDSVIHFLANRLRYVDGNDFLYVKGTQTEKITGDATLTYIADRQVTVGRDDQLNVHGDQDTFILGKSKEQYVGKHEVTAPDEFEWKQMERGFSAMKLDMATFGLDIHAAAADVHVVDAEAAVMEGKGGTFHEIIEGQRMNLIALILATALRLDIMLRADALIDVGTGTPFR